MSPELASKLLNYFVRFIARDIKEQKLVSASCQKFQDLTEINLGMKNVVSIRRKLGVLIGSLRYCE